jgi:hypothetical protein
VAAILRAVDLEAVLTRSVVKYGPFGSFSTVAMPHPRMGAKVGNVPR